MATTYSKEDLKSPDIVTLELKKGFVWTTQHSKLVLGAVGGLLVLGLGYAVFQTLAEQKEIKAQESYFRFEKEFLKRRESFEKFQQSSLAVEKFKTQKTTGKGKTKAANDSAAEPKIEGQASTGDFAKDYGSVATGLESVVSQYPGSAASRMAALTLSQTQIQYAQYDSALSLLQKVKLESNLLSALILIQKGTAQAGLKDCKQAVGTWDQALMVKATGFLAPEIYLKQGLCYEKLGDKTRATESYNKVMAESKETALAKSAEQYLRLLKVGL